MLIRIAFWQPLLFMLTPSFLLISAEVPGTFFSLCIDAIVLAC